MNVPSLRDDNVVKRRVLVAKACQANPKNHFVGVCRLCLEMGLGLSSTFDVQNGLRKSSRRSGGLVVPEYPDAD